MHRRDFLQGIAVAAAGFEILSRSEEAAAQTSVPVSQKLKHKAAPHAVSLEGYTPVAEFQAEANSWKVFEDLRNREGSLVFVSSSGEISELTKSAEASMPEG